MPIRTTCRCGRVLKVRDASAGRKVKCPECGKTVQIPNSDPEARQRGLPNRRTSRRKAVPVAKEKSGAPWLMIGAGIGVVALVGAGIWYVAKPDDTPGGQPIAKSTGDQRETEQIASSHEKTRDSEQQTDGGPAHGFTSEEVRATAKAILESRGASFYNEPPYGMFVDYGLIRGPVEASYFQPLLKFPEIGAIRLPAGATDAAMEKISQLPNLKLITITGAGITDQGLVYLAEAPSLERLLIRTRGRVGFTEAGLDQFKSACPECAVD